MTARIRITLTLPPGPMVATIGHVNVYMVTPDGSEIPMRGVQSVTFKASTENHGEVYACIRVIDPEMDVIVDAEVEKP